MGIEQDSSEIQRRQVSLKKGLCQCVVQAGNGNATWKPLAVTVLK